jgi:hypothetical protein
LPEETIGDLFEFRKRMMPHRPDAGVDVATDWAQFRGNVRAASWVLTGRDRDSVIRTSLVITPLVENDHVFLDASYAYVDPAWRGRWEILVAWCMLLLQFIKRISGRRLFIGGLAYPTSAVGYDRIFPPAWMMGDADPHEPVVARCLARLHARGGGTPGGPPWVPHPSQPPQQPAWWHSFAAQSPAYRRYVAANPDWHLGRLLPVVSEIRWGHLPPLLARTLRRAARRLVPRRGRRPDRPW